MNTNQHELYRKCEEKLDKILSNRDYDLRILIGHSNMLQSLTLASTLQHSQQCGLDTTRAWHFGRYDDDEWEGPNIDYAAESDLTTAPEHVE
ncbi:uncharacterized protein N7469_002041 [Penicillium citrinum]|uniref:Uncharacterized protein n=1 Tax=Penicillium citrinum TaxID=5077 RepID=A0A9W9P9X3_PENCI|nr:uncharacterized protein N7469_002041 [Penicillium citrinum]KAJ5240450.1 hypothetical protein N7469_002041 [Penicillium citrinum]